MLNIYYGRESVDKERFVYQTIARRGYGPDRQTLVIVPDQYTLEAERQAFKNLGVESLIGLDVFSMSRMGHKILENLGGSKRTFIDKYGRQMLLTRIAREEDDNLQAFKGNMAKSSFIELTNNFISEMKQYGATPETLTEIMGGIREGSLLYRKLADLRLIYGRYQEEIKGIYTDSEDLIDLYIDRIGDSPLIKGNSVWVYGFDSFAPKAMKVLGAIMGAAGEVNVVLTYDRNCRDEDLFELTGAVIRGLEECADEAGCARGEKVSIADLPGDHSFHDKNKAIAHLEHELFAMDVHKGGEPEGITLVEAANMYNEAETAAAFILHLLRDRGYRCRDIVIICNDQSTRASVISRVFDEYGLPLFKDKKRKILNSNIAVFLVSMLTVVEKRYRSADVFKTLKTGLTDLTGEEVEKLENYTLKYRIRGTMWQKPFVKGEFEYGAEGLAEIDAIREKAMALFDSLESIYRKRQTVRDFVAAYYLFLTEKLDILEKLQQSMAEQAEAGLTDLAEETRQIWALIVGILDQIVELTGTDDFRGADFTEIFTVGLDQVEVGVLPSSVDDIMLGTMQRTRAGDVKAMVIIGANEGILPQDGGDDGLFAAEELEKMASDGHELCKVEKVRLQEERLAIYRNLSKPADELWISYAAADADGRELRPSEIIDELRGVFPGLAVESDVISSGKDADLIGGGISTLRHYTEMVRAAERGEKIDGIWKSVESWYSQMHEPKMGQIEAGLAFDNSTGKLAAELADILFRVNHQGEAVLSPSRVETFARCPFAYFVSYGLKPEERRVFEVASRELGDVYHSCLMQITKKLSAENSWNDVTEEECRGMVAEALRNETEGYRDGLFGYSNEERYKSTRMVDTCFQAVWALIGHVKAGKVMDSRYEESFGRGNRLAPIEVSVGGRKMLIEGKIDRMDILENGRVKIIDYKSGNLTVDSAEVRGGYRLQLMLYMKAARGGEKLPAGVFYFHIQNPRIEASARAAGGEELSRIVSEEIRKSFRLNGIMVDDPETVSEIAGDFDKSSDIAPVRQTAKGLVGSPSGSLVTDEEFEELQQDVDQKISELCGRLAGGDIVIEPMVTKNGAACQYCDYKSVCRFDLGFDGCRYNVLRY
jgi:ATP-dependent helicase/nuclease subunit B